MAYFDFMNPSNNPEAPAPAQAPMAPEGQSPQGESGDMFDSASAMDAVQFAAMLKGMPPEERAQAYPSMVKALEAKNPKYVGMLDPKQPPTDDILDNMLKPVMDAKLSDEQKKFLKSSVAGPEKGTGVQAMDFGAEDEEAEKIELQKPTKNLLEKQITSNRQQLDQVNQVYDNWDDTMFTYKGKAERALAQVADKAGVASEGQKEILNKRQTLQAGIATLFNAYRKAVTGAAASDVELQRLKKTYLNEDMSPEEARAARDNITRALIRDTEVHADMLKSGIVPPGKDGKIKQVYQEEFEKKREEWKKNADSYVDRFRKLNPAASEADALRYRHMKQLQQAGGQ